METININRPNKLFVISAITVICIGISIFLLRDSFYKVQERLIMLTISIFYPDCEDLMTYLDRAAERYNEYMLKSDSLQAQYFENLEQKNNKISPYKNENLQVKGRSMYGED